MVASLVVTVGALSSCIAQSLAAVVCGLVLTAAGVGVRGAPSRTGGVPATPETHPRRAARRLAGATAALVPVFLAESAPPSRRGAVVAANAVATALGALAADACDRSLAAFPGRWRVLVGAACLPSVAQLLLSLHALESPRWLAGRGAARYAQVVLAKLRSPAEAAAEAPELAAAAEAAMRGEGEAPQRERLAGLVLGGPNARAFAACVSLQALQQVAGASVAAFFGTTVLELAGFQARTAARFGLLPASLSVAGSLAGCLVVDRAGCRPLLVASAAGAAAALLLLSASFLLADTVSPAVTDEMTAGPHRCGRAAASCAACLDASCGFCISARRAFSSPRPPISGHPQVCDAPT